jgi:predicted transcriptional regulator of viral defense system
MAGKVSGRVPPQLLRRPVRVLRPQDAEGVYAHPRPEFARLARGGALHRLATGYYAVVPDDQVDRAWLPDIEAAALGIAAADQGVEAVALMGISAARVHGAIPRALGVAVVAAAGHRPSLRLADREATVLFVRRTVASLNLERTVAELGAGWVTTVEQTLLDLAARPDLGGLPEEAETAIHALLPRADRTLLTELAAAQRRRATLDRVLARQVSRDAAP